ncbi:unnamed protein product [Vitrella brassicaformis CCMP3155]|uniref:CPW-WPC domain-containing protein n=1 Tax=Vitrella brassicaformis (strain CCMP3155) TaxID=1169540 RepID=A0A0G4FRU3_VITBC|nr:unnamed protein product [Vitrella brassicaformis CCMP3155]|eukprot:CEM17369.1 unnamed protein product [Vitrella brassicaformis CCMP3155]
MDFGAWNEARRSDAVTVYFFSIGQSSAQQTDMLMKAISEEVPPANVAIADRITSGVATPFDPVRHSPCPLLFDDISPPASADYHLCQASTEYDGPCSDTAANFSAHMSQAAKIKWQTDCVAVWPCRHCTRDFTVQCPSGWVAVEGSHTACEPPANYTGNCRFVVDFTGFNAALYTKWSGECNAYFPCVVASPADTLIARPNPISRVATLARMKAGLQW